LAADGCALIAATASTNRFRATASRAGADSVRFRRNGSTLEVWPLPELIESS